MHLLLESIRVELPDFEMPLLPFHQQRIQKTQMELWGTANIKDIQKAIKGSFRPEMHSVVGNNIYKCRLLYHQSGIHDIQWQPYVERQLNSLQLTPAESLEYPYKYAIRSGIDSLKNSSSADDILMHRNGLITDTSYANVAFYNGKDWITPSRPLLMGVKRTELFEQKKIRAADICTRQLGDFSEIKLFNAMISANYQYRFDAQSGLLQLQKSML